jgi:stalled ribosome rescue protein Dom34
VFRVRNGGLYELGRDGIDDDPDTYMITKHAEQPHFDNHIKEHRKGFAREAATRIARELEKGRDELLLLAGPEEATSLLLDELPKAAQEKVIGQVHLELRVTYEELVEAIVPKLEEVHEARVAERTDTAIGEARALDLGATGVLEVGRHLERGGVQELFVDAGLEPEHHVDGGPRIEWADELIRQAVRTDADVHVVRDHATLKAVGRVAALLRFRI